jgi:MFS family permease
LGWVEGVAEAIASLLKARAGRWSDQSGRRAPFIWAGYFFAGGAKPLIGIASAWPGVLAARALDRAGKGLRGAPRDALLAEAAHAGALGAALGWHRAMDTLGAAAGPLLALAFLRFRGSGPQQLREIYFWALAPGLAAAAIALTVRDRARAAGAAAASSAGPGGEEPVAPAASAATGGAPSIGLSAASAEPWSPGFRRALWGWGIFAAANSSDAFLLLRAEASGLGLSKTIILYCMFNLVYAFSSPWLGGLSDRAGRKGVLLGGLVAFAATYAGMAVAEKTWHFAALFAGYGLFMAATDGVGKAFALDLAGPARKATAVGAWNAIAGGGALIASVVAGALWARVGPWAAFAYGSAGAIAGAAVLVGARPPPHIDASVPLPAPVAAPASPPIP